MNYFLNLFSPETYEAFTRSNRDVTGFKPRARNLASRVRPGDRLLCYLTVVSRWCGLLEVLDGPFDDASPIFFQEDDPFVLRFRVRTLAWLPLERAIPIHDDEIWTTLSITRGYSRSSSQWTGKFRGSLVQLDPNDGAFLEKRILAQAGEDARSFPVDLERYQKAIPHRIRRPDGAVTVTVPTQDDEANDDVLPARPDDDVRESIRVQALLADIGIRMGMNIWIPRGDRAAVLRESQQDDGRFLERLPLNYDDTTLKTVEQIDVLWLKGRSIKRAFEVEHTTSVYSGILRMADLLALQPNMAIKAHIVAPATRREKVLSEIQRPVFSLLERGPLADVCTFLSYDSVRELSELPHLAHLAESVVDEYAEEAEV